MLLSLPVVSDSHNQMKYLQNHPQNNLNDTSCYPTENTLIILYQQKISISSKSSLVLILYSFLFYFGSFILLHHVCLCISCAVLFSLLL